MDYDNNILPLPELLFFWDKTSGMEVNVGENIPRDKKGIVLNHKKYFPVPEAFIIDDEVIIVIGNPIIDEHINRKGAAEGWLAADNPELFFKKLNGQFVLIRIDRNNKKVTFVSDRFNGIPLYWADLGHRFIISSQYFALANELKREGRLQFHGESMFEFIWLQRVMGDKTHDELSRFMLPATFLEVSDEGVKTVKYWHPDFTNKSNRSESEHGKEFISLLKQSVSRLTSDKHHYGLFLSGGHDSRVLLSAFDTPPECFTVGYTDNYEVQCAREVASAVGANHHFINLPENNLVRYHDDMARLCGGMFATDNAFFMGIKDSVNPYADVFFHGHGFDYLFQGMYLPTETVHWLGRPTFFRKLRPLNGDLITNFLTRIPFREREVALLDYVKPDKRDYINNWMRDSIQDVLNQGEVCCNTDYDRWEYLIVHSLGRHYSRPNIDSKMTLGELRTVCFDNDLFDFYCRLPIEHRLNAETMRYALNHINPKLAQIPTGNYALPAGASPLTKTRMLITRKIRRHLTGNSALHAPDADERTWPDRDTYLRKHHNYRQRAIDAVNSKRLQEVMPFMDWERIQLDVEKWLSDTRYGGAKFMVSLMSLDRFLRLLD